MGAYTGAVPSLLSGQYADADKLVEITNFMTAMTSTWTAYTPIWTANISNPVLGNGTLTGRYRKIGKTVDVFIELTMGSTTTFGSGIYFISMPSSAGLYNVGSASLLRNSPSTNMAGIVRVWNSIPDRFFLVQNAALVSNTSPHTWAVSDQIQAQLTYMEP